jgi:glycogen debranching enzyme
VAGSLEERARQQLAANTRTAVQDGVTYRYTIPSPEAYLHQWHWDSCFHAIVWASFEPERARDELRSLVARQLPNGLLPHVIYWDAGPIRWWSGERLEAPGWSTLVRTPRSSGLMQPPVVAQALEEVAADDDGFARELLPAVARHYRYLANARDPDADGLVSIVSQFESGLDFSPVFDPSPGEPDPSPGRLRALARGSQALNKLFGNRPELVLRVNPRHWEDVLVNSVYADGLASLERLAARAGDTTLQSWARTTGARTLEALLDRCYDERRGLFFSLLGRRERRLEVKTVESLMPLLLESLDAAVAARLVEHLADPRSFWPRFPVPSVALDEPSFTTEALIHGQRCIWRGPCAPSTNWLLWRGLRRHGYDHLADKLAESCRELADAGGFNEFYDPVGGRPVGKGEFGWGTLPVVMGRTPPPRD